MVSGSWGSWWDAVRASELLDLPIRLDRDNPATQKIARAVARLPEVAPTGREKTETVFAPPDLAPVLTRIDAAVADLFELTTAERDLVADFWASLEPESSKPLAINSGDRDPLQRYLAAFVSSWAPQINGRAGFAPQIWRDQGAQVIAVVFEIVSADNSSTTTEEEARWTTVLERYCPWLEQRADAGGLVTYGILRAVSDTAIVVVKRNERRLWTASAAREDAEATLAQAMALQRA
jgi:hypothetical protein